MCNTTFDNTIPHTHTDCPSIPSLPRGTSTCPAASTMFPPSLYIYTIPASVSLHHVPFICLLLWIICNFFFFSGKMENTTLTGLLKKAAAEFPNKRAISVSGKLDLTHAQLQQLIDYAASLLIATGIKPGDVVALTFPNTVEVGCLLYIYMYIYICSVWIIKKIVPQKFRSFTYPSEEKGNLCSSWVALF